jgi:hypothetical protein
MVRTRYIGKYGTPRLIHLPVMMRRGGVALDYTVNITPTYGADQLTNGAFEAPYTSGLANGWTKAGTPVVAEETTIKHGGSSAQRLTGDAAAEGVSQYKTTLSNCFGLWEACLYPTENNFQVSPAAGTGALSHLQVDAAFTLNQWNHFRTTNRITGSGNRGFLVTQVAAGTSNFYMDDFVFKQITLASCLGTVKTTATGDVTARTKMSGLAAVGLNSRHFGGVMTNINDVAAPTSFVIGFHDGAYAGLLKCVLGSFTSLISSAVAFVAGAEIKVEKTGGTTFKLYYDGVKIGTTQTVADAEIVDNLSHAQFATDAQVTFSGYFYAV